jgi:hypothetical protein
MDIDLKGLIPMCPNNRWSIISNMKVHYVTRK